MRLSKVQVNADPIISNGPPPAGKEMKCQVKRKQLRLSELATRRKIKLRKVTLVIWVIGGDCEI